MSSHVSQGSISCRATSLGKLAWRPDKLQASLAASLNGSQAGLRHASAWLYPLSHLHPTPDGALLKAGWIEQRWQQHVRGLMQCFQQLCETQLEVSMLNGASLSTILRVKKHTNCSIADMLAAVSSLGID